TGARLHGRGRAGGLREPFSGGRRLMTRLVWRQYRWQAAIAALVLAVFATVLIITGLQMAGQWHSILLGCAVIGTCGGQGQGSGSLGGVLGHDFAILSLMAPALFGMLV